MDGFQSQIQRLSIFLDTNQPSVKVSNQSKSNNICRSDANKKKKNWLSELLVQYYPLMTSINTLSVSEVQSQALQTKLLKQNVLLKRLIQRKSTFNWHLVYSY